MRLIDADELIQSLDNRDDWTGQMSLEHMANINMYSLINSSPTVEMDNRWIPCTEREPSESGWYLVTEETYYSTEKEPRVEVNINKYEDGHWLGSEEDIPMAWMPLPEPYKKEGDKE